MSCGRINRKNWAQYHGADDVEGMVLVRLDGVYQRTGGNREPLLGIEILKSSNGLGFAPAWVSDEPTREYEADDIHDSLSELCKHYALPIDDVIDRVAVALLRATQPPQDRKPRNLRGLTYGEWYGRAHVHPAVAYGEETEAAWRARWKAGEDPQRYQHEALCEAALGSAKTLRALAEHLGRTSHNAPGTAAHGEDVCTGVRLRFEAQAALLRLASCSDAALESATAQAAAVEDNSDVAAALWETGTVPVDFLRVWAEAWDAWADRVAQMAGRMAS